MRNSLAAIACLVAGCGEVSSTPTGDPAVAFQNDFQGRAYAMDVALGDGADEGDGRALWAGAIFTKFAPATDKDIPASIERLPTAACAFEKPAEGALVRHVHVVDGGDNQAPVYAIDKEAIANRAENFVNYYFRKRKERPAFAYSKASDALSVVNVAVTEMSAPVYLVLTAQGDTIFNMSLAPGARLARIAVLGSSVVGVANAPDGVAVEGLFNVALSHCGVRPERMPEDHWGYVRNVKESNIGGDILARQRARALAYGRWFHKTFGASASDHVGAMSASTILIGPAPASEEALIAQSPLAGARVLLSPATVTFAADSKGYRATILKIVRDAAQEAAGGDLQSLTAAI